MQCSDARTLLPGLALGDLDAEPAREIQAHLKDCADCRDEQARLSATVAALEAAPPAASSTERREASVKAMGSAHAEEAERLLAVKPRRWLPRGFAAGLLIAVAAAAVLLLNRPAGLELPVAAVSGSADVYRAEAGLWSSLSPGDVVRSHDRVVTQAGTRVEFRLPAGSMIVDENSSIALGAGRTVMLDRGRLYAEMDAPSAEGIVFADTANNSVTLRRGKVEASLREVKALVASATQKRGDPAAAQVPAAKEVVARRLTARVVEGEAELGGARRQRLEVAAGREGSFDLGGQPRTSEDVVAPDPWWISE